MGRESAKKGQTYTGYAAEGFISAALSGTARYIAQNQYGTQCRLRRDAKLTEQGHSLELPSAHVCSHWTSLERACKQMPQEMRCLVHWGHSIRLWLRTDSGAPFHPPHTTQQVKQHIGPFLLPVLH